LCLMSLTAVAEDQEIDYTCNPQLDYNKDIEICPKDKIQNGVCDNPNHGGDGGEACRGQDCIDCNYHCMSLSTDCFGCLNAKGCYYCPGDATCQNSDLYQSENKVLSCTKQDQFWLAGRDNPDELCIAPDSITQDPLALANNWAYKMINVDKVWPTYTGRGVRIRINDSGVDVNNKDFEGEGKYDQENSCSAFAPKSEEPDDHGTKVAGIAVGNANNAHCAAGIAYDASLSSCNFFDNLSWDDLAFKLEGFDISLNSIQLPACTPGGSPSDAQADAQAGAQADACPFTVNKDDFFDPCDEEKCDYNRPLSGECEENIYQHCRNNYRNDSACLDYIDVLIGGTCNYERLPDSAIVAMTKGVTEGRGGKGAIYVFSSGNDFYKGEDVNMSRWTNSRYTITVGAVGKDGLHTDYSTPGAALTVSGPVGDYPDVSHIMTTGLGGACADSGPGTSFSAPVVTGVIALMLEARPDLTWRDVQGILATTSQRRDDPKDTSGKENAVGIWHSNWYGFGVVDAKTAVDRALAWELYTPEYQATGNSAIENKLIPNDGTEFVSELIMSSDYDGFTAESTVVLLNLQHYTRGDLEVTLVSPEGTESILHPGRRPESEQLVGDNRWKLMTVRNWGEDPTGTWKLKIKDLEPDNTVEAGPNEFRQWRLIVYGRTADGNPPVLTETPVPTSSPSGTPTATASASAAPSDVKLTNVSDAPSFGTPEETEPPVKPVVETESPVTVDTVSPSESPTAEPSGTPFTAPPSPAPVGPTYNPTVLPAPLPTRAPVRTRTPASRTLPPFTVARPTSVIKARHQLKKGPIPLPDGSIQNSGEQNFVNPPPTLRPTSSSMRPRPTTPTRRPTVSTGAGAIGNAMNRPAQSSLLQKFGQDDSKEEKFQEFFSFDLAENLSLEFRGVTTIPKNLLQPIQLALQEHTTSVVSTILPALQFEVQVELVSLQENEGLSNRKKRSLRPDNSNFSVILVFNELVQFHHVPGTEDLSARTLAALAFKHTQNREAFVELLHKKFDVLESLSSVSVLSTTPSVEEPKQISKPTDSSNNSNTEVLWTYGEHIEYKMSENDRVSNRGFRGSFITWSLVGVGFLCGTIFLLWRRRKSR